MMKIDVESFERIAQEEFDSLPEDLQAKLDNVHIVVEEFPDGELVKELGRGSRTNLLGLYQGIPQSKRGVWYGMYAVVPDKITLFKENIQRIANSESELRKGIRETLIHEIAHYYGMNEEEIRNAGY